MKNYTVDYTVETPLLPHFGQVLISTHFGISGRIVSRVFHVKHMIVSRPSIRGPLDGVTYLSFM